MIRFFDILFSFFGLFFSPVMLVLFIFGYFDTGNPIFCQERVGKAKKPFRLVKSRSMHVNAPSMATHLVKASSITPFGRFLRKSKLDVLLQLWNVLLGNMSMVGPCPNYLTKKN
jgi:O-antigen biosynthesis protein WbqP